MPKMKTKSGAKKRFRFTASGKVKHGVAGKRHGMTKRGNRFLRRRRDGKRAGKNRCRSQKF